jgi:superfamily II DNA or RNA helicase
MARGSTDKYQEHDTRSNTSNKGQKKKGVTREGAFSEAQQIFRTDHRVAMEFCTGFGKTYAALKLIAEDLTSTKGKTKWYILVPRKPIVQTWYDEMDKWGFKWMYQHKLVEIINYSSSHKLKPNRNYCLDEAHNITDLREGNMSKVVAKETRIIAASATIDSEKFTILRTFGFKNKHRIIVTLDEGVESGAVTDYKIFMLPIETNALFRHGIHKLNGWQNSCKRKAAQATTPAMKAKHGKGIEAAIFAQTRHIYNSYQKLLAAQYVISQFAIRDKYLVYCSNQNFAEQLGKLTGLDVIHSSQKDTERDNIWAKFQKCTSGGLISCYTISEGVTVEGVNKCLVVQTRKKERELIQRLGRILRFAGKKDGEIGKLFLLYLADTWDEGWAASSVKSFMHNKVLKFIIPKEVYQTEKDVIDK